jgi:transposase
MAELVAARSWLTVYRLPPHASELNPAGAVWPNLKISLANLTKQNRWSRPGRRMQYRTGRRSRGGRRPA